VSVVTCKLNDCTVAATGTCLLHTNPDGCENAIKEKPEGSSIPTSSAPSAAVREVSKLKTPARTFHSGLELGTQDAAELMRAKYTYLIGILGCFDAGKTCFMSSLYLLAACRGLPPRYKFAGSLTLQGFEDRVRKLRKWEAGLLPTKLSDHTSLADPRTPSLMHIAFKEQGGGVRHDFLLTDLPGEWTKELINNSENEKKFRFLHRADGIIVVVDGPALVADGSRPIEHSRLKLLLARLKNAVQIDHTIPLIILVSKCDKLQPGVQPDLTSVVDEAKAYGFLPHIIMCTAFSSAPEKIPNGTGVVEAVEKILESETSRAKETIPRLNDGRNFQKFRA